MTRIHRRGIATTEELSEYKRNREYGLKLFMEHRLLDNNFTEQHTQEQIKELTRIFDEKHDDKVFNTIWNEHLDLINKIKSNEIIDYPREWGRTRNLLPYTKNRHEELRFYIEGILLVISHGDMKDLSGREMGMFYNREHFEPPLNAQEFDEATYRAEMRIIYLERNKIIPCPCTNPMFKKMIDNIRISDEMKAVKLLSYTEDLFKHRKCQEPICKGHTPEEIHTHMLTYNDTHDKLNANKVHDIAFSKCDDLNYYHKDDDTECEGYKHQLLWEQDGR